MRTEAERAKMEMERVEKAAEARRRRVPPAPRPSLCRQARLRFTSSMMSQMMNSAMAT